MKKIIVVKLKKTLEEEQNRCKLRLIIQLLFLRARENGDLDIGGNGRDVKM